MTKEEAIEMLDVYEESTSEGFAEDRKIVHSFSFGGMGCDWDLAAVEAFINEADVLDEAPAMLKGMGHSLMVVSGGRRLAFATKANEQGEQR